MKGVASRATSQQAHSEVLGVDNNAHSSRVAYGSGQLSGLPGHMGLSKPQDGGQCCPWPGQETGKHAVCTISWAGSCPVKGNKL